MRFRQQKNRLRAYFTMKTPPNITAGRSHQPGPGGYKGDPIPNTNLLYLDYYLDNLKKQVQSLVRFFLQAQQGEMR